MDIRPIRLYTLQQDDQVYTDGITNGPLDRCSKGASAVCLHGKYLGTYRSASIEWRRPASALLTASFQLEIMFKVRSSSEADVAG